MTTDKRVAKLKQATRSRDAAAFCQYFLPAYINSPDVWLKIAREQRLIENFRDADPIRSVREIGFASLHEHDRALFINLSKHIDVCLVAQGVFDYIDQETRAVSSETTNRTFYNQTVVGISEVAAEATIRNLQKQIERGYRPTQIRQFSAPGQALRDITDCCNILLSSSHPERSRNAIHMLTDNPQINRLIELAMKYSEAKAAFDLYSYGRYLVASCNTRSIDFIDADYKRGAVGGVAAERIASYDNTRMQIIGMAERQLEECLNQPLAHESFEDYLPRQDSCVSLMARFADAIAADLEYEIKMYFDTETVVDERSNITVAEVIECWAALRAIVAVVTQWQHKRDWETVRRKAVASLRRPIVVSAIRRYLGCSGAKARALVRRFQGEADKKPVDLFFRPLLLSDNRSQITICSRFIETGRFERNIFSILVADGVLDQDKKGFRPIKELVNSLREAGFLAAGDVRIYSGGELITDADVIAYKDGELFVGQAKVVIEPDTIYEVWKAENRLIHAAKQLRSCEAHLDELIDELRKRYPDVVIQVNRTTPFILTNTRQFTEMSIDSYPVVDLPYVEFVLGGAKGTMMASHGNTMGLASTKSFISGEYPTAAELRTLLHETIHAVKKRYKGKGTEELAIGPFKISSPTTLLHPSPHPFMKVLTDQEMENFISKGDVPPLQ
jgi:hypothetical protein